ncbi:MAG: ferritin-like domain-containing protein, partial [Cyanobacteria bacterium J06632_19]
MYEALISGIKLVGEDKFSWKTTNQQKVWQKEEFKQIIASFEDAENAVKTISLQGEGTTANKDKFMIPSNYCLEDENDDPHDLNEYSHYERLLKIKNQGVPDVY